MASDAEFSNTRQDGVLPNKSLFEKPSIRLDLSDYYKSKFDQKPVPECRCDGRSTNSGSGHGVRGGNAESIEPLGGTDRCFY